MGNKIFLQKVLFFFFLCLQACSPLKAMHKNKVRPGPFKQEDVACGIATILDRLKGTKLGFSTLGENPRKLRQIAKLLDDFVGDVKKRGIQTHWNRWKMSEVLQDIFNGVACDRVFLRHLSHFKMAAKGDYPEAYALALNAVEKMTEYVTSHREEPDRMVVEDVLPGDDEDSDEIVEEDEEQSSNQSTTLVPPGVQHRGFRGRLKKICKMF